MRWTGRRMGIIPLTFATHTHTQTAMPPLMQYIRHWDTFDASFLLPGRHIRELKKKILETLVICYIYEFIFHLSSFNHPHSLDHTHTHTHTRTYPHTPNNNNKNNALYDKHCIWKSINFVGLTLSKLNRFDTHTHANSIWEWEIHYYIDLFFLLLSLSLSSSLTLPPMLDK